MGKPTARNNNSQVKTKTKSPKNKRKKNRPSKSTNIYTPKRIDAEVSSSFPLSAGLSKLDLPFHTQVGHLNLQPYAWITLKGDENKEAVLRDSLDGQPPTRHGLKSLTLSNEYGKYPSVTFVVYVNDYRDKKSTTINDFIIGSRFSVKWGYSAAHTKWGTFRTVERNISFEEGTALLKVKGVIGSRLLATTSSEVFSNVYGESAIEQMASLVDISVDYKELLDDEYKRIFSEATSDNEDELNLSLSGNDLGWGMWHESQRAGVEMYFNPELEMLKFSTPFKKELVKRGQKPTKLLYGFPASNIATLELDTSFPKKKGTGSKKITKVKQPIIKSFDGDLTVDNTLMHQIVAGPQVVGGQKIYIAKQPAFASEGGFGRWFFDNRKTDANNNVIDDTSAGSNAIVLENAYKVYDKKIYKVHIVDSEESSATQTNLIPVVVVKTIKVPKGYKNIDFKERTVTLDAYNQLIKEALSNKIHLQPLEVIRGDAEDQVKVNVHRILEDTESESDKQSRKNKPKEETPPTTTQEAVNADTADVEEGEETTDVYVFSKYDRQTTGIIRTAQLRSNVSRDELDLYKERKKELEAHAKKLNEANQYDRLTYRVNEVINGEFTIVQIETGRKQEVALRTDPAKPSSPEEEKQNTSETSTGDPDKPEPSFVPATIGKKTNRKRKVLTKVTIKFKAGDWTMRVGKLIEILDVHAKVNGVWYVEKEDHVIDTNGFHTKIVCRKATSKQKNTYGRTIKGSGRGTSKGDNNTRKPVNDQRPETQENQRIQFVNVEREEEIRKNEEKKAKEHRKKTNLKESVNRINPLGKL